MLAVVITAGLVLLVAGGVWQLSTARLDPGGVKERQLVSADATVFSPEDRQEPGRILDDRDKLRNAVAIVVEVFAILASLVTVTAVVLDPGVPVPFKLVAGIGLPVGAALVARALYVRLGLYHPAVEELADYRDSLAAVLDDAVAEDFVAIHRSLSEARGEDPVDEVTVGVLAVAREERPVAALAEWGESAGVADGETVERRVETLVEAGLVERDGDSLRVGQPIRDADESQVATVAASVLS